MESVEELVGVPFVDGGRDFRTGLDCWGLVREAYKRVNRAELPDFKICAFHSAIINLQINDQASLRNVWQKIEKPERGCLVLIKNHPRFINHIGLCVDEQHFIHTLKKLNAVIEPLNHPLWKRRTRGFFRYNGTSQADSS